jgi:nicotinamidase-related amidase
MPKTPKRVHLLIDMQNCEKRHFVSDEWAFLETAVVSVAEALEARNIPTIHVFRNANFMPFDQGVGLYEDTPWQTRAVLFKDHNAISTLPLTSSSLVFYKRTYSICQESSFLDYIEPYDEVYLSGLKEMNGRSYKDLTHSCVSASAYQLSWLGKKATIVADATPCGNVEGEDFLSLDVRRNNHRKFEGSGKFGIEVTPLKEILAGLDASPYRPYGVGAIFSNFTGRLRQVLYS